MSGWVDAVTAIVRDLGGDVCMADIGNQYTIRTGVTMKKALIGWRPGTRLNGVLEAAERDGKLRVDGDRVMLGTGAGAAEHARSEVDGRSAGSSERQYGASAPSLIASHGGAPTSMSAWVDAVTAIVRDLGGDVCMADIGNQYTIRTGVTMKKALIGWRPGTRLNGVLEAAERDGKLRRLGGDRILLA